MKFSQLGQVWLNSHHLLNELECSLKWGYWGDRYMDNVKIEDIREYSQSWIGLYFYLHHHS